MSGVVRAICKFGLGEVESDKNEAGEAGAGTCRFVLLQILVIRLAVLIEYSIISTAKSK